MKASRKMIARTLLYLRASLRKNGLAQQYAVDEPPLRSELFSADQMEDVRQRVARETED